MKLSSDRHEWQRGDAILERGMTHLLHFCLSLPRLTVTKATATLACSDLKQSATCLGPKVTKRFLISEPGSRVVTSWPRAFCTWR